jgi:hypothetical protein
MFLGSRARPVLTADKLTAIKHRNFRTFSIQSLAANSGCPWYVSNSVIRKDLQIPTVKEEISCFSSHYGLRLRIHTNELIATLTEPPTHKRLRRYWPNDLLTRF